MNIITVTILISITCDKVYAELLLHLGVLTLKYMINSRYQSGNTDVMVQDIKKFNKLTNDFVTLGYIKL